MQIKIPLYKYKVTENGVSDFFQKSEDIIKKYNIPKPTLFYLLKNPDKPRVKWGHLKFQRCKIPVYDIAIRDVV